MDVYIGMDISLQSTHVCLANAAGESDNARLKRLVDRFDREHNATPEALLGAKREILRAVTEYNREKR